MIPQISKALSNGFSSKQIIDFLLKKFPAHADKIKSALAAGFTTEQVLKFISGGKKSLNQPEEGLTEFEKTRNIDIKRQENVNKTALAAGGIALSPIASQAVQRVLSNALPQSLHGLIQSNVPSTAQMLSNQSIQPSQESQLMPQEQKLMPSSQELTQQPPSNIVPGNIQQPTNIPQGQTNITNPKDYLEKKGVLQAVDASLARKNSPEQVATELGIKRSGKAEIDPELLANIEAYAKEKPQEAMNAPELQVPEQANEKTIPGVAKEEEEKAIEDGKEKPEKQLNHNYLFKLGELPELNLEKGKLVNLKEKTHKAAFGKEERPIEGKQKPLKNMTYEEVYRDSLPEDKRSFKVIDNAMHKLSQNIISGKTFSEMHAEKLPEIEKGLQLSTARDVLDFLAGLPSKYQLLSDDEKEDAFSTFQGLTPNVIWNMLSLTDPRIQKIAPRPISPKGTKEGKKQFTPNDFRRMLAHGVHDFLSKHEKFGEKARYIVPVVNMIEIFKERKNDMQQRLKSEVESMTDEDLNHLLSTVDEEMIRKLR